MTINIRSKGQRAERALIKILQPVIDEVLIKNSVDINITLERNQNQSNFGGYDIIGISWLAIEVKHQEILQVDKWWQQCIAQSKVKQVPVLFYKRNNVDWRIRLYGEVGGLLMPVEISMSDFLIFFRQRLCYEYC